MKKYIIVLAIFVAILSPAFSQLRIDIGITVPRGVGAALDGSTEFSQETADFFKTYFIPFPEAAFHYQFDLPVVKLGLGVRAYTFIIETVLWPNAFAEFNLGPVAIEAQLGGGAFGLVGLYNSIKFGAVLFPDLSVWYKFGQKQSFRLGVGALGIYLPEIASNGMAFAYYLGGKITLENL